MNLIELTDDEWFHIRRRRGAAMTGQTAHWTHSVPVDPANPTIVRGVGKTYYWCMGLQPDADEMKKIARECPLDAAKAYLARYEKGAGLTPVPKKLKKVDPTAAIKRMSALELLKYAISNPEVLSDSYYREFGNAIRARTKELT